LVVRALLDVIAGDDNERSVIGRLESRGIVATGHEIVDRHRLPVPIELYGVADQRPRAGLPPVIVQPVELPGQMMPYGPIPPDQIAAVRGLARRRTPHRCLHSDSPSRCCGDPTNDSAFSIPPCGKCATSRQSPISGPVSSGLRVVTASVMTSSTPPLSTSCANLRRTRDVMTTAHAGQVHIGGSSRCVLI